MRKILLYLLDCALSNFRSRAALQLEVIVLRHQLEVLQRTRPARVRLTRLDRILWLLLYRLWPRCLDAVVIVKPETVIAWHHKGFRAFWAWKSRPRRRGRPPVPAEVRTLIRRITRAGIPAKAYWAVTLYNVTDGTMPETKQLIPSRNSFDKVDTGNDGSIDLYFGPKKPDGVNDKNWIQTIDGRAFMAVIRLYGADIAFFDQTWKPDDVVKVK